MAEIKIRALQPSDWGAVSQIYLEGIHTGMATFEKTVPSFEAWHASHLQTCRLVALAHGDGLVGWAALTPVSSRCVYGGVAEVSVYIGAQARGKGVGQMLMAQLIHESEAAGFWTLQSGIFPENSASVALHQKMGFRYIGKREKVAKLNGEWKDNLLFERRSTRIGID